MSVLEAIGYFDEDEDIDTNEVACRREYQLRSILLKSMETRRLLHGFTSAGLMYRLASWLEWALTETHAIADLVGKGGIHVVTILCQRLNIHLVDLRHSPDVLRLMADAPPRCVFVVDCTPVHRSRHVFVGLADNISSGRTSFSLPGSTDDKLDMLLYWFVPRHLQNQREHLRPLAEAMVDYGWLDTHMDREVIRVSIAERTL